MARDRMMQVEVRDRPFDMASAQPAPRTAEPEPERWSVSQTALLVVGLSAGLWLVIGATAHWLLS